MSNMECYICKALEEKGRYRYRCEDYTTICVEKGKNGRYRCFAYGEGAASISCNFCPNCGRQLEDVEKEEESSLTPLSMKEKGFDDDSWVALTKIARVIHKESVRNALDIMLKTYEKSKYWAQLSLYEFAAREHMIDKWSDIYKLEELDFDQLVKDYTEYKSMVGNLKHATFGLDTGENEKCPVCNGLGLIPISPGVRGMVACQVCNGTGQANSPFVKTIKHLQEDIKELEEYVEYWQKECDRRQAKIDKALEDIDKLIAGTYMKTNGEATYGYYQSGCCTQRLNIIRDDLKGEENCNDNNWMSRYWKGEED